MELAFSEPGLRVSSVGECKSIMYIGVVKLIGFSKFPR